MKKLLLVAVVLGGLMFPGTTRSDAQVYFSIGFGPGYYRYYPYCYYYPYRYYARPIIARTIGTADIVITDIIIPIITSASLIGIATPGWLEIFRASPIF